MAGIKAPLESILARLATITVTNRDGQNVALYSRVWNNQVEREKDGETYIYPKPAAFVEFVTPVTFDEIGQNMRSAILQINVHLVHEYLNADGTFEQDLEIFDIRDKVVASLSQFKPTGCGLMVSITEQQDYDHDNVYHYVLTYQVDFIDSKGSPYDPGRGVYIEKAPPTGVEIIGVMGDVPVMDPNLPYKIPPQ